jgi:hypothetical protein
VTGFHIFYGLLRHHTPLPQVYESKAALILEFEGVHTSRKEARDIIIVQIKSDVMDQEHLMSPLMGFGPKSTMPLPGCRIFTLPGTERAAR